MSGRDGSKRLAAASLTLGLLFMFGQPLVAPLASTIAKAGESEAVETVDEAAQAELLSDKASAAGALGTYYDWKQGKYVVVFPSSDSSWAESVDLATDLPARIEYRDIELETIAAIDTELSGRGLSGTMLFTREPYAYMFDPRTGRVEIYANGPLSDFDFIAKQYAGSITLHSAHLHRLSRGIDAAPHKGGAYMENHTHAYPECSTGFAVKDAAGTKFMVTAGHCGQNGDSMWTGSPVISFGTIFNKAPFPYYDMTLIHNGLYTGQIYTGGTTGTVTAVKDAHNPSVGSTSYCTSGWATNETCGHHVISLTAKYCNDAGTQCTQSVIALQDGSLPDGGDSGGPVYNFVTSAGVTIRGVLFAKEDSSGTIFAERWTVVQSYYSVSIVTT